MIGIEYTCPTCKTPLWSQLHRDGKGPSEYRVCCPKCPHEPFAASTVEKAIEGFRKKVGK